MTSWIGFFVAAGTGFLLGWLVRNGLTKAQDHTEALDRVWARIRLKLENSQLRERNRTLELAFRWIKEDRARCTAKEDHGEIVYDAWSN